MRIGVVYVVRLGDVVKIGFTSYLANRIKQLESETGKPAAVLKTIPVSDPIRPLRIEREIHAQFQHLRLHPRGEWFRADSELLEWAAQ